MSRPPRKSSSQIHVSEEGEVEIFFECVQDQLGLQLVVGRASPVGTKTPSVTHAWRCTCWLSAEPKRWTKETAPSRGRAVAALVRPAAAHRSRSTREMKILVRAATALWRSARKQRNFFGTEITHWRTGTGGMT